MEEITGKSKLAEVFKLDARLSEGTEAVPSNGILEPVSTKDTSPNETGEPSTHTGGNSESAASKEEENTIMLALSVKLFKSTPNKSFQPVTETTCGCCIIQARDMSSQVIIYDSSKTPLAVLPIDMSFEFDVHGKREEDGGYVKFRGEQIGLDWFCVYCATAKDLEKLIRVLFKLSKKFAHARAKCFYRDDTLQPLGQGDVAGILLKYWTAEIDFKAENEGATLMFETPELVRLNLGRVSQADLQYFKGWVDLEGLQELHMMLVNLTKGCRLLYTTSEGNMLIELDVVKVKLQEREYYSAQTTQPTREASSTGEGETVLDKLSAMDKKIDDIAKSLSDKQRIDFASGNFEDTSYTLDEIKNAMQQVFSGLSLDENEQMGATQVLRVVKKCFKEVCVQLDELEELPPPPPFEE